MRNEVGISYYTREEFELARKRGLPGVSEYESYDEWLEDHRKLVSELLKRGVRVVEVVIDTEEFLHWCSINGVGGDGAVADYTAEMMWLGRRRGRIYIP